MNALFLAGLLCAPVSAQVVETGGAGASAAPVSGAAGSVAAPSPVSAIPGAASLAPSLNTASVMRSLTGAPAASRLPAGAAAFAPPIPALPAAAAVVDGVPGAAPAPTSNPSGETLSASAAAPRDAVPPPAATAQTTTPGIPAVRPRSGAEETTTAVADGGLSAVLGAAGSLMRASADNALSAGRRLFDWAGQHGTPTDRVSAPAVPAGISGDAAYARAEEPAALAPSGGRAEAPDSSVGVETLRDAVASPVPAAAAGGAAPSFFRALGVSGAPAASSGRAPSSFAAPAAAPFSFARLSLELGDGLSVRVRAALGMPPLLRAQRPFLPAPRVDAAAAESATPASPRAPVTSTEWLERRGLLESISASEAAASQTVALPAPAPARASLPDGAPRALAASPVLDSTVPPRVSPLVWWSLAFLPAAFVLFKELL